MSLSHLTRLMANDTIPPEIADADDAEAYTHGTAEPYFYVIANGRVWRVPANQTGWSQRQELSTDSIATIRRYTRCR